MYDYGWLSCRQHQDSLIWLNLAVIRCAASEPCWLLLPIRAQWTDVTARVPSHMPNPEYSAGILDQLVLSNQAWVPQYCCVCRKCVRGEQSSFSSRITGPALLEKNTTVSDSAPSTLSWQSMQWRESVLIVLLVTLYFLLTTVCMKHMCSCIV